MMRSASVLAAVVLAFGAAGNLGCMVHDGGSCGGGGCGTGGGTQGPPPVTPGYAYRCPMDGAAIDAPGACPQCGMTLDERHRVARQESPATTQYVYKCPMDGSTLQAPGPCPKCGMTLDAQHRVPK